MSRLAPVGFKPFNRTVTSDTSVLAFAKWDPFALLNSAGAVVTAATIDRLAAGLAFAVNAAAETDIGTYTGNSGTDDQILYVDANIATVKGLINAINGMAPGHPAPTAANAIRRWRAGLGDFRPGFAIGATSGMVVAAANAMLGRGAPGDRGLPIFGDSSGLSSVNAHSIGMGTQGAREGFGQIVPDHFQSSYQSTTAGVVTPVRDALRQQETDPASARFQVFLTGVFISTIFATTKVFSVYDVNDNLLYQEAVAPTTIGTLGGIDKYNVDNPICVGPMGSPLFCEVTGTGALTIGPFSVQGFIRIS